MTEMYCLINGKVQNVAYRVYAQDAANNLGVMGWIKNLPDGTVEIVAQGMPDQLKEFVEYLHEGSLLSTVESVSIDWRTSKVVYDDFSIKYD
jgi:acylphosphatase